ncbi:hypothetical protein PB01_17375 [Psychrobacillus glaciei]|uniref:Uncharacterized protein n=1 Tax=Psychrobacillus glaciei TaxID=2283160 RepID=A0A5J6SS92_9BACI|nr:hypothetical protein [Psychrobacillus glaciei]QFG00430.1 hypothetical protein PB01_17375 [Psychrobacillus glaciei]
MSWEVITRNNYPCKCGAGTYTYISEMDDWSRTRVKYILDCNQCKEKYFFNEGFFTSKEVVKISTRFQQEIDKYVEELNEYIGVTYYNFWLMMFSACKTKKDYWNELKHIKKELGIYPQSLGTFYKDVNRYENIEIYLLELFKHYSKYKTGDHFLFDRLMKLMDISDKKIDEIETRISKVDLEMKEELKNCDSLV